MISLAKERKGENEKLHIKIVELESQLHDKHAGDGDMEMSPIGVKRLGDLDLEAFQTAAKREYFVEDEVSERAAELCYIWENHIRDHDWKPFRSITDRRGRNKEIVDEEDLKLKNLEEELGDEAYEVELTVLLEMKEYNPSGRYKVEELWNFQHFWKASLLEGVKYLLEQLDLSNSRKRQRN